MACCILHNLLRSRFPRLSVNLMDVENADTHEVTPGTWRREPALANLEVAAGNTATNAGKAARDYLCAYVNSEAGSVEWQDRMI